MKKLKIIVAFILVMPLAYCAFVNGYQSGPEISGVVTDIATGKPLSGVNVVWHWDGRKSLGFVDGQSTCYRAAIAKTDNNGRYVFSAWKVFNAGLPYIYDKSDRVWVVFKPGYSTTFTWNTERGPADFKLPKFEGTEKEYYDLLFRAYDGAVCTYSQSTIGREQKQQMINYLMAIQAEAMKLKSDKHRQRLIDACKDLIEQYKHG